MAGKTFELGQIFMSRDIRQAINDEILSELIDLVADETLSDASNPNTFKHNTSFAKDVAAALRRYKNCDWSDMKYEEDKKINEEIIENNLCDRIFATYNTCKGTIYIITEADRSYTTILFPGEY